MDGNGLGAVIEIGVDEVVYRKDLYPRSLTNPQTVQTYHNDLDVMPPIEVNQHNILIDGWHRWTAHRKAERPSVRAIVTETTSDLHILQLAVRRNAKHGLQLSQEDKQSYARTTYNATPDRERAAKKQELVDELSVTSRTIQGWLSRIDKDTKEARNKTIRDLWLACHTQEEIAGVVGVSQKTVDNVTDEFSNFGSLSDSTKADATHATGFDLPIYNVWKQQTKTNGVNHFGSSEVRWVDNLLYLYTKPFDVVVDPFAGSGSTIDICKKRLRRYWVSDRKPIVERETEIRCWDVTEGLPALHRWTDVRLVYLDPPYWKQAEGRYSSDPSDFGNMPLERFRIELRELVMGFAQRLGSRPSGSGPAYIALILQPTQWNAPERAFTDHIGDLLRDLNMSPEMRYSVPYESQQCTAQMVEWAKEQRRCLVLTREIVVWRVGS